MEEINKEIEPMDETVIDTTQPEAKEKPQVSTSDELEWKNSEEFKKAIQSASSKAKNEIIQSLKKHGFNNLNDVQAFKESYKKLNKLVEDSNALKTDYEKKINDLNERNESLNQELILKKLNISDEYKDDFIKFSKVLTNEEKSFDQAAQEVVEKYSFFKSVDTNKTVSNPKIGVSANKAQTDSKNESFLKRYPWLR